MFNYKFTIFTPTFNRKESLYRCYESILEQKNKNLEWIVIDDGSTDNTQELIQTLIKIAPFKINYIFQENAGKQSCWNRAISIAKGDYFIGVDSDDCLAENALQLVDIYEKQLRKKDIIGLRCQSLVKETNAFASRYIPKNNEIANWYNEFFSGKHGDKIDIFKTDIIRTLPYPTASDMKFVPELYFYNKTSNHNYKFVYLNIAVGVSFNDQPKITRLSHASKIKHCKGYFLAYSSLLVDAPIIQWISSPLLLARVLFRLNQSVFYLKENKLSSLGNIKLKCACILIVTLNKFRK